MRFFDIATVLAAASAVSASPVEKRAAAVDELVGFAAGTTGGGPGAGTMVSDCAGLAAAAKKGGVIKIKGTLTGCGIVKIISNTSVLGVGSTAGITDGGLQVRNADNVIIRNIKFYRAPKGKDLVGTYFLHTHRHCSADEGADIDESTRVWVDHNDFSSVGITGDKDTYDGLLDAKHGADSLTFSWNKFHDHVSLLRIESASSSHITTVEGLPRRPLRQQRR
jgi:pectate lyase